MKRMSPILLALGVLVLSVGLSMAQGRGPMVPVGQSGGEVELPVGSQFTYQGQLKKDGRPFSATCTMAFRLYDDATAGNLRGAITTTVAIADGLFTVPLDFGPYAFRGSARWLEIAVACPGDPGFFTLAPRQALTAVPYALSLRPGAEIIEAVDSGAVLVARNTVTSSVSGGLLGVSDSTLGYGVFGRATAESGQTYGVYGVSRSPIGFGVYGVSDGASGTGVYGAATSTAGLNYGVYGTSPSPWGAGVRGWATATSGETCGVCGQSDSPDGYGVVGVGLGGTGVLGLAGVTSGSNAGVYGRSDTTQGRGIYGRATALSGTTYGVYGQSDSTSGRGVYGVATATTGPAHGVIGESNSTGGHGVHGSALATSGTTSGVYGYSLSTAGRGVFGWATANTGSTYGVYGRVDSAQGVGVYGYNSSTSSGVGVYGVGPNAVIGESSTPGYAAIYGRNQATTGTGMGLYGRADSPDGWSGYFYTTAGNGVYISAPASKVGLTVASGTKNAVVRTSSGSRLLYSEEATEVWFADYGFGRLQDGKAVISIDPLYAQTVNLEEPYHVFLQVYGAAEVYVSQRSPAYFEVRLWSGDPNVSFSYRIVAKRLGYEDTRMAPAPWADNDPNLYPERVPAEP